MSNKKQKIAPWPTLAAAGITPPSATAGSGGGGGGGLFDDLPEAAADTCEVKKKETVPEVKKQVTEVRCLHLLKKHTGSRRPSSWREKVITRSLEEATYRLKELRKGIAEKASPQERQAEFEKLARKESDCGSAAEGGSLGKFGRGKMQPAFEEASFRLEVNEMSGVVTTDSGVHIILRLE
ncbi:unnamed protein product [Polarella glacialis]|uniref:Peptidyl-prolyl cis-trans isomerase n=1 Tax=Polarella glacialis TaxID=89957 RepID=A0A813JRC6_POLGL|nr:unnamed protein product [Polarella glacialis]CAE8682433.1 unnamed protein product [Polarella glacialis]|mmetsp:Transcript_65184/g.105403  ORF Transcript_65184/g.105403 Transcript_65184/m.105403 type:complete len:181 (-) Transcript_65184:249-791(-)